MTGETHPIAASVDALSVELDDGRRIVDEVTITLRASVITALVGESGSGKTTVAMSLLGHVRAGAIVTAGEVTVDDTRVLGAAARTLRGIRGRTVSHVPQDPAAALNPALRIGTQLREIIRHHRGAVAGSVPAAAVQTALHDVGLPSDRAFLRRYPHQLSGGQLQRVMIAMAIVLMPKVLVLDEPTTALDVITQAIVLDTVRRIATERELAVLYVSHDLAAVAAVADELVVMSQGRVVEHGAATTVFHRPRHPYTRSLLDAVPVLRTSPRAVRTETADVENSVLLSASGLSLSYGRRVVVHEASFAIGIGRCLGLVGQSGSGKTSIAQSIVGLHQRRSGELTLSGKPLDPRVERRSPEERRRIQYVFQSPYNSLNPRRTIGESLGAAVEVYRADHGDRNAVLVQALESVRLRASLLSRYPGDLSGGERQRVCIARALIADPELLVCDEITSALDVSVQASLIELLQELRVERKLSLLFVTHNLPLVSEISDELVVLENGIVVDYGSTVDVLSGPSTDYTRRLIDSAPRIPERLGAGFRNHWGDDGLASIDTGDYERQSR